jgi:tetratricopeptide (TPR) repeat protein
MREGTTRAIIVEKTRGSSTGRCWVTKSAASLRKSDGTVVNYKTRLWFTWNQNELTPLQANRVLSPVNGAPDYRDVLYIIISLREGERKRFAGSDDELAEVMQAATIEAMQEMASELEARRLVWVACAHPDYPHPCVKVLISRDIGRGQSKALKAFPRKLRSHWLPQKQQDEKRVLVSGGCEDAFLRVFDAAIAERSRPPLPKEEEAMSEDNDEANLPMDWIKEYAQSLRQSPNIAPSKRRTVIKDDDEEAVSAAEAQYELEQVRARRGLEYLDDDPDAALDPDFVLQRDYNKMRQRTPDDAAAHDYYGELFMRARLHSEAVAAYERVVQLKPGDGRARYNYAAALEADMIMRFGDTLNADSVAALERVFAQYETACQLDPTLAEAQSKRRETGSYLMNMRAMVQQYGIEGTREMLRQEKARQSGTGLWQKLKNLLPH